MTSFHGYVATPLDAALVIAAVAQDSPLVTPVARRLTPQERAAICSGHVYVFSERDSGMRRWTDGMRWSKSRVEGHFLVYRRLEEEGSKKRRLAPDTDVNDDDAVKCVKMDHSALNDIVTCLKYEHGDSDLSGGNFDASQDGSLNNKIYHDSSLSKEIFNDFIDASLDANGNANDSLDLNGNSLASFDGASLASHDINGSSIVAQNVYGLSNALPDINETSQNLYGTSSPLGISRVSSSSSLGTLPRSQSDNSMERVTSSSSSTIQISQGDDKEPTAFEIAQKSLNDRLNNTLSIVTAQPEGQDYRKVKDPLSAIRAFQNSKDYEDHITLDTPNSLMQSQAGIYDGRNARASYVYSHQILGFKEIKTDGPHRVYEPVTNQVNAINGVNCNGRMDGPPRLIASSSSNTSQNVSPASSPAPRDTSSFDIQVSNDLIRQNNIPLADQVLCKKTFAITSPGNVTHVICYYMKKDIVSGKLKTPSQMPQFAQIAVPRLYLDPSNYRLHLKTSRPTPKSSPAPAPTSLSVSSSAKRFVTVHRIGESQIMHINLPTDFQSFQRMVQHAFQLRELEVRFSVGCVFIRDQDAFDSVADGDLIQVSTAGDVMPVPGGEQEQEAAALVLTLLSG